MNFVFEKIIIFLVEQLFCSKTFWYHFSIVSKKTDKKFDIDSRPLPL